MGDQEKTSKFIDFIMGQVIHFFHFFFQVYLQRLAFYMESHIVWLMMGVVHYHFTSLLPFALQGEKEGMRNTKHQEKEQELEDGKKELEKEVEDSPSFSTIEFRRENLLKKIICSSSSFSFPYQFWGKLHTITKLALFKFMITSSLIFLLSTLLFEFLL